MTCPQLISVMHLNKEDTFGLHYFSMIILNLYCGTSISLVKFNLSHELVQIESNQPGLGSEYVTCFN